MHDARLILPAFFARSILDFISQGRKPLASNDGEVISRAARCLLMMMAVERLHAAGASAAFNHGDRMKYLG